MEIVVFSRSKCPHCVDELKRLDGDEIRTWAQRALAGMGQRWINITAAFADYASGSDTIGR